MKKKRSKQQTHRAPITAEEQVWMFSVAIRDLAVFNEARAILRDDHFNETEQWLALVWRVAVTHFRVEGSLPSKRMISTKCTAELELNPDCIPDGHEKKINQFLTGAFNLEEEDMPVRAALDVLQKFLEDRLIDQVQEAFSMPQTPVSLVETFTRMGAEAQQAASLGRGTLLPDDLEIICHPPGGRDRRCQVIARRGELSHEHYFVPFDQYQRALFCTESATKLGMSPQAQRELEDRVLAEARKGIAEHTTANVVSIADDISERVHWMWEPYIAFGTITLLVGRADTGKSTVAFDLAARLSRSGDMPGVTRIRSQRPLGPHARQHQREPIASLLLIGEDSANSTVRPRLLAAGADVARVRRLPYVQIGDDPQRPPQLPTDIEVIERTMIEMGARLLVVDVLGCFLGDGVSLNDDAGMRQVLTPLAAMAQRINAAVLIILHLNKKTGLEVLDRIAGSTAIGAAARTVLFAAKNPDDPEQYVLAVAKNNLDRRRESMAYRIDEQHVDGVDTSRIVWTGVSSLTAAELLEGSNSGPNKLQQAEAIITRMIAAGRLCETDIQAACLAAGISERTYRAARHRLGVVSERTGYGADGRHTLRMGNDRQPQRDGP